MKYFLNIFLFLSLASYAYASSGSASAVSCDVYDAATGTKLNSESGKIVDGQCKVGINTSSISSSSVQLMIRVTLDNGVQLKALEEQAAGQFLSGKKEVTSEVAASPSGMLAYYQGLVAGGASCLSQSGATALSAKCLEGMRFKSMKEVVANLKEDSSASGQSVSAMASMMRGFLNSGGSDGMKDPVEFLKRLNDGDSSVLNRASDLARAGGEIASADAMQRNFILMQKVGQIAGTALQDKTVQEKFVQDEAYKQKYFDFFKNFDSADQAIKVATAGAEALKSFFSDGDSFKSTNATAARELFIREADSSFAGLNDSTKAGALFKTLAATDYRGKSIEEIKNGVGFISGYVRASSDPSAIAKNPAEVARYVEQNSGIMDPSKMDSQYFDDARKSMQSCNGGSSYPMMPQFDRNLMPKWTAVSPAYNSVDVSPWAPFRVSLDREIDPASVSTDNFYVHCMRGAVQGRLSFFPGSHGVDWSPENPLPAGRTCYARITGLRGFDSTTLPTTMWSWTVAKDPFQIVSVFPNAHAQNVPLNSQIRIAFNYPIDQTTADKAVTIKNCRVDGSFSVSPSGKEIRFYPSTNYSVAKQEKDSDCQIEISPSLRDTFGRALGHVDPIPFALAKGRDTTAPVFGGLDYISVDPDSTSLTLSWRGGYASDDGMGPIFYDAYCGQGRGHEDFSEPTATIPCSGNIHVYDLSPDQLYCCMVKGRDLAGNMDNNRKEVCAVPLAPPPRDFFAYPDQRGRIGLTWSMVSNAQSYRLYIRNGNSQTWNFLAQTSNPYYTSAGLQSGAYYSYMVSVVTANGEGGSNSIAFFRAP